MIDLQPYICLTTMMILATKDSEGNPYTSNVYFKCDENHVFYFRSKDFREHSKHILGNGNIAWSIINTEKYHKDDTDKKGLQFQGCAKVLTGSDAERINTDIYGNNTTYNELQQAGQYIIECIPRKVKIWDEKLYNGEGKVIEF